MATLPQQPEGESFRIVFEKERMADGWLKLLSCRRDGIWSDQERRRGGRYSASVARPCRSYRAGKEGAEGHPLFVSRWPSPKANRVYRALLRIGWKPKEEEGLVPHPASTPWFPGLHVGLA
jgi:hypothetical protein